MASRLPSSNDAQDGATSQFPHTSPVPMETDDIELEAPTLAQQQNHPQNFMNPREATIEPIAADIYEDNDPRKLFGTSQLPLEREFEEQVSAVSAAKPVSSFISSNTPFHECETNVKQLVKRFENADESEREKGNGSVAKLKEDSPMTSIDLSLPAQRCSSRNLQQLDWQKEELMQAENNVEELRRLAMIRVTSMEILRLSKPQTVCRSQKCARYERIDGKEALIYRVCHKDCYLDENGKLDGCAVFLGSSSTLVGVCTECSCHIYDHERIPYEQRITTKSLDNPQKLASETNAAEMKKSSIRKFERLINGYQKESNYILFAMATFSVFLAENGITQKTNLFEQHLQKLIVAEEKKMKSVTGVDADEFNRLLELSVTYEDICKQFVHQRDSVKISLDELQEIRQKLFSLPLNGAMIAQIFDIHVETNHQDYEATVTRCEKSMFQKIRGGVKKLFSIFGGSTK
ncbi:unnamed protein product, partial [Mesorhabditis belari]|uniref:DUF8206 domain-containing protein n=1 Tax=Mesorhabditis belari TaxID=2138241 RepID=A0AAF3ENB8_9BILA